MPQTATAQCAENSKTSGHILAAASDVARKMGPGFAEKFYVRALAYELELRGITTASNNPPQAIQQDSAVGESVPELVVNGDVLVEIKSAKCLSPEHITQCLSDLKTTGLRIGLLLNFQHRQLEWKRLDL